MCVCVCAGKSIWFELTNRTIPTTKQRRRYEDTRERAANEWQLATTTARICRILVRDYWQGIHWVPNRRQRPQRANDRRSQRSTGWLNWTECGLQTENRTPKARHRSAPSDQLRCTLRYFRGWQCRVCRPISLWTVLSASLGTAVRPLVARSH